MKFLIICLFLVLSSLEAMAFDATHGMVLFGKERLYAYHLPMFHKIHNKQMVFTFEVPEEIKNIINQKDEQFFTFVPAPFDLDQFIAHPFELKGDLYSGHFEKEGTVLVEGVTLSNPAIVYLQEIIKPIGRTSGYKNEVYQFFGSKTDLYALHLLDGGSAIDQIFKITPTAGDEQSIDHVLKFKNLINYKLLELGSTYSVETEPGHCPSRLCGEPGRLLAKFKIDTLYFEDQVM